MNARAPWVIGVTGASGAPYARRVLQWFAASGQPWDLTVSESARVVLAREQDVKVTDAGWADALKAWLEADDLGDVRWWPPKDMAAGPSSGSYPAQGLLVVPCSMNTLAAVAHGFTENLVQRAASVCLKERRPVVLCFRESPLNRIHLQNLLAAHDAGATVVPAAPGFYSDATEVAQLIDFVVGRVLDVAGIANDLYRRWTG
ncbi:MAG TPA: UbiX family flavin prenyltransferase [Egibacteraceae bacterium]|nr:UbiX family flavin prenyltransferase [Egibacteraceae bacterium]